MKTTTTTTTTTISKLALSNKVAKILGIFTLALTLCITASSCGDDKDKTPAKDDTAILKDIKTALTAVFKDDKVNKDQIDAWKTAVAKVPSKSAGAEVNNTLSKIEKLLVKAEVTDLTDFITALKAVKYKGKKDDKSKEEDTLLFDVKDDATAKAVRKTIGTVAAVGLKIKNITSIPSASSRWEVDLDTSKNINETLELVVTRLNAISSCVESLIKDIKKITLNAKTDVKLNVFKDELTKHGITPEMVAIYQSQTNKLVKDDDIKNFVTEIKKIFEISFA